MIKSYIPNHITYVYVDKLEFIKNDTEVFNNSKFVISGKRTIVCDSNQLNRIESAKDYLNQYGEVKTTTLKNNEISELQLIDVNDISDTNNIYVLVNGIYAVRMYKDVLIDALINKQVSHGNFIGMSFIWINYNGYIKLIRINSKQHKDVIKFINYSKSKKISSTKFKVGKIYENSRGLNLYLGKVNTASIDTMQYYMYNNINDIITYVSHKSKPFTTHLWMKLNKNSIEEIYRNGLINYLNHEEGLNLSYLDFYKTKRVVNSTYKDIVVSNNIVDIIRETFINLYERAETLFNSFFYTDFRFIVMSKYPEKIKMEQHLRNLWFE